MIEALDLLGSPARHSSGRGMGGHQTHDSDTTVWLTPPAVLDALGPFDLDPCAAPEPRPWPTAAVHYGLAENGLSKPWRGRVWLNPPYGAVTSMPFLRRMAAHGHGTALIFARTETALFCETVWGAATALLFLAGRLHFHRPNGERAQANAGAPSVLVAYGDADAERLRTCGLPGAYVRGWLTAVTSPTEVDSDEQ